MLAVLSARESTVVSYRSSGNCTKTTSTFRVSFADIHCPPLCMADVVPVPVIPHAAGDCACALSAVRDQQNRTRENNLACAFIASSENELNKMTRLRILVVHKCRCCANALDCGQRHLCCRTASDTEPVAFLFRQQHLDRVHMSFSLHLAKVNSARKPNGIPSEPVNTPSIISLSQNFNLSPEEIKNFQ